jgi:hypothetical protein
VYQVSIFIKAFAYLLAQQGITLTASRIFVYSVRPTVYLVQIVYIAHNALEDGLLVATTNVYLPTIVHCRIAKFANTQLAKISAGNVSHLIISYQINFFRAQLLHQ